MGKELDLVRDEWERERLASESLLLSKAKQLEALKGTLGRQSRKETKARNPADTNFAREIAELRSGCEVFKLTEREGKKNKTLFLDPDTRQLQWKRNWPRKGNCFIELTEVINVAWGRNSRAYVVGIKKVQQLLKPWLCFSIYTKDRSFDFIIPDGPREDKIVQSVVLALAAMCHNAGGVVQSRGGFVIRKALMKIDETCRWQGMTRVQYIRKALEKTARDMVN